MNKNANNSLTRIYNCYKLQLRKVYTESDRYYVIFHRNFIIRSQHECVVLARDLKMLYINLLTKIKVYKNHYSKAGGNNRYFYGRAAHFFS